MGRGTFFTAEWGVWGILLPSVVPCEKNVDTYLFGEACSTVRRNILPAVPVH